MSTQPQRADPPRAPWFLRIGIVGFLIASFLVWTLPVPDLPTYDLRRFLEVGGLVVVGGWVAFRSQARFRLTGAVARLPAIARSGLGTAALLGVVAAVAAPRPVAALREVSLWVLLVVVGLLVAGGRRRAQAGTATTVLDGVVIVAIAYVGMYLLGTIVWGASTSLPGFEHPRFFNHVQVLILPLLAAAAVSERWSSWRRVVLWAVLVGWWHLLFVSGGRAALLAVALGLVVGGVVVGRGAFRWALTYVLTGVLGAAVYLSTLLGAPAPTDDYGLGNAVERGVTATGRGHLWDLAVSYVRADPILGIGPGHYAHEAYVAEYAASPHNLPLQFAAEWGVPASVLLLLLAGWGLIAWLRNVWRRDGTPVSAAVTAALVGVSVDAMFGGSVNDPTAGVVAALVAGLALGRSRGADPPEGPRTSLPLVVVTATTAVVLAVTTATTYRSPADETGPLLRPRFWLNGVIPEQGA